MTISRTPPASQIEIAIYKPSYDGQYWGRYPNGDKPGPNIIASPAAIASAASGALSTQTQFAGASSIQSAVSGALTTSGGGSSPLRYHPGFYAWFDYSGGTSASKFLNGDKGLIQSLAVGTSDNVQGLGCIYGWRSIDVGTGSGPDYDWSLPDAYAATIGGGGKFTLNGTQYIVAGQQKQYWHHIAFWFIGGSTATCANGYRCCPDWLINTYGIQNCQGNVAPLGTGTYPKFYYGPVQTAIQNLVIAFAARYGSDPFCEGVMIGIGSALPIVNAADKNGINYDAGFSTDSQLAGYLSFQSAFRSETNVLNFASSSDYMFNADSTPRWTTFWSTTASNRCGGGGPDSMSQSWVYTNVPYSPNYPQQNAAAPNNPSLKRGVRGDQERRGWWGGEDFRPSTLFVPSQELTEMGGYIGQISAADVWSTRGPNLDNAHYMIFDINFGQSGNYGMNKSPNTLWLASPSYEATYGPSVYTWIKQQTGLVFPPSPYA